MPDYSDWKRENREKWPLLPGFTRNQGEMPKKAKGKRVLVALMHGVVVGAEAVASTTPIGWAADTTRWTLTGRWYDVDQFKIL